MCNYPSQHWQQSISYGAPRTAGQTWQSNAWVWVIVIVLVFVILVAVYNVSLQNQPILAGAAGAARDVALMGSANAIGATTGGVFARVAHAAPAVTTPVNVIVNGNVVLPNVTYGAVSDYLPLAPNTTYTIQLQTNNAIVLTLPITTPSIMPGQRVLLTLAAVNGSPVRILTFNDPVLQNNTGVRFYHLYPNAPQVTVAANGNPLFSVPYQGSQSSAVGAGTYRVTVAPTADPNTVVYSTNATVLANQVLSVFAEGANNLNVVTKYSLQ